MIEAKSLEKKDLNIEGDLVKLKYDLVNNYEQNPFRVNPSDYESFPELCASVRVYLNDWEDYSNGFLTHIMRYARLMSDCEKTPFPIDFFKLDYGQYMYHMKWYRDNFFNKISGRNWNGLKHRKDCVNAFLIAYGINPLSWRYKLPSCPKRKSRHITPPKIVHDIINYNFYPDNKEFTKLMQYIHAHNFWIGPRPPSELSLLKTDSFNFEEGYIDVIEQKIHYSVRTIYPENPIMIGKTRKSFKNYIDYVRPKFVSQHSGNALYIGVRDGKPIGPGYMGRLLGETGRMVYPLYSPYSARHWCATARLIKAWIEREPEPTRCVKEFLGHDAISSTEGYTEQARVLFKKYSFDWLKCTLKLPNKWKEESALKSKQSQKRWVSNGNIRRSQEWARRDLNS